VTEGSREACPPWLAVAALAAAVLFIVLTLFDVVFIPVEKDEGAYTYAFRQVAQGRLPYRDFSYIESPALPYYYVLLLSGPGIGLRSVRVLGALTGLAGLSLLVLCAGRAAGKTAAAITAVVLFANPYLAEYFACDVTYPLVTLLLALALRVELLEGSRVLRTALQGILLALSTAVKVSMGLVALIWLTLLLWRRRGDRRVVVAGMAAFSATLALTLGPFVLADAAAFRFNVVDVPRLRGTLFPFMRQTDPLEQSMEFGWGQKLLATRLALLWNAPLSALALLVGGWPSGERRGGEAAFGEATGPILLGLIAGLLFHLLIPFPAYPNYFFMLLPALTVPVAARYARQMRDVEAESGLRWGLALPVVLGVIHLLSGLSPERLGLEVGSRRHGPDRELTRIVTRIVPPDGLLLTDYLPVAVAANRRVVPGNEGGRSSLMPDLPDDRARAWRVLNRRGFLAVLHQGRAQGVVLTEQLFERSFDSVPGFMDEVERLLRERYMLIREFPRGVHSRYGRIRVFCLRSGGRSSLLGRPGD